MKTYTWKRSLNIAPMDSEMIMKNIAPIEMKMKISIYKIISGLLSIPLLWLMDDLDSDITGTIQPINMVDG